MSWYGFGWVRDSWIRLCGPFPTLGECHRALSVAGREHGLPDKLLVMTGGMAPSFVPRTPARASKCSAIELDEPV
jgi:hypothetical protein